MILNVKFVQLESGLAEPLMENPGIFLLYITPTWTTSLRQFMQNGRSPPGGTRPVNHEYKCAPKMFKTAAVGYQPSPLACTSHHVIRHVHRSEACMSLLLAGKCQPTQKMNEQTWSHLPIVSAQLTRLWRRYTLSNFLQYTNIWRKPTGQQPKESPNLEPTEYPSLSAYLSSLPKWYQLPL
jgi:hypothetical protein